MFLSSIIKSFRLSMVYSDLNDGKTKKAFQRLLNIMYKDKAINLFMASIHMQPEHLYEIYGRLELLGAGQYVKGHYVAAAALVFIGPLIFIIETFDGEGFSIDGMDNYNSGLFVANRLIQYFEKGETGLIDDYRHSY